MQLVKAAQLATLMLSPTMVVAAALYVPRGVRAVRRAYRRRHTDPGLTVGYPPIEQLAADLRRLLVQHETVRRSAGVAMRARHLVALEAAITDCAAEAARALGLPCPERPVHGPLTPTALRQLLQSLAAAGMVMPPAVGLLSADKRL
jgi:hypothetical protein